MILYGEPNSGCSDMRILGGLGFIVFLIATLATLLFSGCSLVLAILALACIILYCVGRSIDALTDAVGRLRASPEKPSDRPSEV